MDVEAGSKKCSECGIVKPFGDFSPNRNGLTAKCKVCLAAYSREMRKNNYEYALNQRMVARRWIENNRDHVNECQKIRYRNKYSKILKERYKNDEEYRKVLADRHKKWAIKNSERRRELSLQEKYGISLYEYNELFEKQKGRCAICNKTEEEVTRSDTHWHSLYVDHDHGTGKVRGLLCLHCNNAIGMFGDDLERVKKAVSYLESYTDK